MSPVAESTSGSGGGGGGTSTATGSIKSIVKSGAARLDVQFDQDLVQDNANLEAGDFSISGAGGITVTSAEYTTGAPDKVSLVLSAALPNTGTLNVSYDGSSHGTGALQFIGQQLKYQLVILQIVQFRWFQNRWNFSKLSQVSQQERFAT